jgi:hypothetical protein
LVTTGTGGAATSGSTTGRGGNAVFTLGSAGGTGTAGAPGQFEVVGGTVGAANTTPFINLTGTWNTTGVVDAAIFANITNTASGAASKLIDLQIGGASEFNVDKGGNGTFTGSITTPLIDTTTKCAGAGTAANPSVASCSAAPAGFFSCATNASTGTCVVDTTAVTANSVIQIQPDSSLGTALSVTCNTTADSGLTAPRVSARAAGTSFTITLGTFTTNPECFSYIVIN